MVLRPAALSEKQPASSTILLQAALSGVIFCGSVSTIVHAAFGRNTAKLQRTFPLFSCTGGGSLLQTQVLSQPRNNK
jgi:hypothetical protein